MKEKYDFGERKVTVKTDNLQENTELKEQYDFVTEANVWGDVAKAAYNFRNSGYIQNALKGAGAGATIGAVGSAAKNMVKRDDDPTKKGFFGSLASGAVKGAGAGATVGAGATFASRTALGTYGLKQLSNKATQGMNVAGKAKFAKELNRAATTGGRGSMINDRISDSRMLGLTSSGEQVTGLKNIRRLGGR